MSAPLGGHDPGPAVPDRAPTLDVGQALSRLRLEGAIFLRGEYTEAWAYESLPARDAAAILAPGAAQVILFHVVAAGRCWIEADGGDRLWAGRGDVIVLPYNDQHRMGGSAEAACVPIAALIDPPPWSRMPVIRHGQGGARTTVACGYLTCDDPLFDRRLRAFPPAFVVSPPPGPLRTWVRASIDYALAATVRISADRFQAPARIPELLLCEVLKLHLASTPGTDRGWLRAIEDPVLAPVIARIHAAPERKWTVASLADQSHVSPSLLDERFREVLGLAPIRYLTGWRMHVAEGLLRSTDESLAAIARKVGYDSEESFSRAFKRTHGEAPSTWRVRVPR